MQEWDCGECGRRCTRAPTRGQRPKWCSTQCADLARYRRLKDTPRYREQQQKNEAARLARKRRAAKRRRARRRLATALAGTAGGGRVFVAGSCATCRAPFVGIGEKARYCSSDCRPTRGVWRVAPYVRRHVYERDRHVCQICHEDTEPGADPLSAWYPSLDHIVPRCAGGSDDVSNLRTAHRWCNSVRGDETYYTDDDLKAPGSA